MSFFEDIRGRSYPMSRISWIGSSVQERKSDTRGTTKVCTVALDDESTVEVYEHDRDRLVRAGTVVPATPGYQSLTIHGADPEDFGEALLPIIAWIVSDSGGPPTPVTPAGARHMDDDSVLIKGPAGEVICPYDGVYDSVIEYLREMALVRQAIERLPDGGDPE